MRSVPVGRAARLLRPGGASSSATSPLLMACTPAFGGTAGKFLERPYFGSTVLSSRATMSWSSTSAGDWIHALQASGFAVEDLIEVRPAPDAPPRYDFVSTAWARDWPSEDIWTTRRT